jgi:Bacterial Ig domain
MRFNYLSATFKTAVLAATVLLLGVGLAVAQQTINLIAAPTTLTLPDGSTVPMWGYSCGTVATGSTATCAALNPNAPAATTTTPAGWSPVVVTVPYVSAGTSLTINLTNSLSFTPTGATTPNTVPTSMVIVGQVGGGLGVLGQRTTTTSPDHSQAQSNVTWPIAANPAPTPGTPPVQGPRVQSFATEVATGVTTALTWSSLRPGTYLLESGTHPSIQVPMGLYGILVVTAAPVGTTAGTAYPATGSSRAVTYSAEVPLEFSEIDPVQNNSVNAAVNTVGFSETMVWSGQPGGCGNPSSATYHQCYPPAVNYIPLYYLINGVAFNRTNATSSVFSVTPVSGVTGNVLVRLVNAGSRMHVPSIVGSLTTQTVATTNSVLSGFSIIAEDGNVLPGVPKVQSDLFMAAGKTNDVLINVPTSSTAPALAVFDRELSLSGNATERDAGMLAYISINGAGLPTSPSIAGAVARADTYSSLVPCTAPPCAPVIVSDPGKGVIANDTNVYGVQLLTAPAAGRVTLNTNGTFTYVPNAGATSDTFTYCANGSVTATTCSSGLTATVTLGAATIESASGITCTSPTSYTANTASYLAIKTPGVLSSCKDAAGYPLTATAFTGSGLTVAGDANGGFNASLATPCTTVGGCPGSFTFQAKNSQGTLSSPMTVNVTFPVGSGLSVTVLDGGDKTTVISDYRWIIEEDKSFYVNPNCTTNTTSPAPGCPAAVSGGATPTFGVNFHPSHMEYVAQGCTGPQSCESGQTLLGQPAVCDVGNGVCRTTATQETEVDPSQVPLDPTKRYYISVLPGDAANPFAAGYTGTPDCSAAGRAAGKCGHGLGGAPIMASCFPTTSCTSTSTFPPVTALTQPSPYPPAKLSVQVFEDDFPLNGEQDAGGGVDILATNEPGLGGFNIELVDQKGTFGDVTGQMTYDMFNQPLSNSLAGTIDPATRMDACPISMQVTANATSGDGTQQGITGQIVTCPKYESDGVTLSPLAGEAVIANLMPGFYSVIAMPGADRIARGEEWLQTNTLDGQKAHDAFVKIGEPAYFQEYGPAGFHVSVGFANPGIINARLPGVCNGSDLNLPGLGGSCNNSVTGKITSERMSRTPDQRLYSSGSRDAYSWTQCFVSIGDPDGEDFAFTKCAADGTFSLTGLPPGIWRLTVFDQWNDQIVDGLSTPVQLAGGKTVAMGDIPQQQWQSDLNTRTFIDDNKDGVYQSNELGIPLASVSVRFRDGELANNLLTDFGGVANFNETFPLFNWYTVETDPTRYKTTGIHTVYDAGGPADGTTCGTPWPNCGSSVIAKNLANTYDPFPLPANLSVPGAVYCNDADCTGSASIFSTGTPVPSSTTNHSTGRIDAPWVWSEGWQGFIGQFNFIEFGKTPYAVGENGGITGHVIYASTRPFDDPMLLVQTQWEPLVPRVTMNLYQEGFAADGITPTLKLVDTTKTSSWDDWAQGFRSDGVPYMNCPGQSTADLFYFTLYNQPDYLDVYNSQHGGPAAHTLPYNSQYKCYDGMHNWNQVQPAPYDGAYAFPSVTNSDPTTGKPTGTNCTICITDPDSTDQFRFGTPMLPAGKYVVEVVLPPGFELVKEEDKNILIGDNFIAPVTQEFGGLGDIFIIPDQAQVAAAYNANNAQNPTESLGAVPRTSTVPSYPFEPVWPCVGEMRIVPDYMSIFPQAKEVAAFAGATRPLCDRKEVTLGDQTGSIAKFFIFTSTHIGSKFTGIITDDFTSEFDPFAPTFGEKFSPPNMPVSFRDWTGNEISRVYSDHWGVFNGMTYSTWEVNPPNPTGYAPGMMINCMNDAGPIPDPNNPGQMITDPLFNPLYSQFCYEDPYMPGVTDYLDTPVVPTAGFVGAGYNNPDCAYPTLTPAVSSVTGDVAGPWVSAAGHTLTINALGDQQVNNYGYSGPSAQTAPYNQKKVTRHYGFGSTAGTVTIGGKAATVGAWSDTAITVTVPTGVPQCAVQQQQQYGAPGQPARCGELVITAATGQQSIDAVTITIGGKTPTVLGAGQTIQSAIDAASPGDMIIVPPGTYRELVIMWKPVRLQGVGAASSIIDATTHPAGTLKLDAWRRRVNCLFGLALNGQPSTGNGPKGGTNTNPYDPSGTYSCPGSVTGDTWNNFSGGPNYPTMVVDRIPLEGILGWDATVNGNLAEQLQEPSIMGSYEGAAITVVAKGVNIPAGSTDVFGSGAEATFPMGSTLLTNADCTTGPGGSNLYPSNFQCNPSSIDAMGITDASQGGGAIFLHAWTHNLQIANNRVYNNSGTLSGGMVIGQGEFPEAYLAPTDFGPGATSAPGSCQNSSITNTQLPYCLQLNVNMHHNMVTYNSSTGDELFTGTPAGAGGVSICTGSDYYQFNYNWVCGNMSSGDGGGVGQLGFSYNGDIEHNTIIFNQSTNPTIAANGGGLLIMGAAPDGTTLVNGVATECGSVTDNDCVPGLSDGIGPGLVINANLLMGNAAEAGSGGGLRFQAVNGADVARFPANPERWYSVQVTNNVIANNVAGWDGGGVSLEDSLVVNLINNTIASNDTTASSGTLFNTLGAPLASSQSPPPTITTNGTSTLPQPAGVVTMVNSPQLTSSFTTGAITCPNGHYQGTSATNGTCTKVSYPMLQNNVLWQNRAFNIGIGALSTQYQQNIVSLFNAFTGTAAPNQTSTGACPSGVSYWDIGVRGDSGPSNHASGFTLAPTYSVLTDSADYPGLHNLGSNPALVSQYCNGSRVPPENGGLGYQVPPRESRTLQRPIRCSA